MINSSILEGGEKSKKITKKKNIMLREYLTIEFNMKQWAQISMISPKAFHRIQQKIFHYLMLSPELFCCCFSVFYWNHVNLYHWYLLAKEKHHEIKNYVFLKLLNKKQEQYKDEFKNLQQIKNKQRSKDKQIKYNQQKTSWKESLDQMSQKIFSLLSDKSSNARSHHEKNYRLTKTMQVQKRPSKYYNSSVAHETHIDENKKKYLQVDQSMNFKTYDFHELYVKTFHACDGERYIFYNHEKHMKGISEMRTYNNFIRKKIDKKNNWKGENLIKRYKSEDQNEGDSNNNRMYKFEPYNDVKEKEIEKKGYKSQVIFRRYKRQNFGKFIRK